MNFKNLQNILIVYCLMLSVVACTETKTKTAKIDPLKMPEVKKDIKKAAMLNVELGEKYLAMGQVARAKKKITYALNLQPDLPEANNAFGYFLETVAENNEAEKYYKKAIRLSDDKSKYYSNYGNFLCNVGRYADAESAFMTAAKDKKYTKTAEVYENAGICAMRSGDKVKSKKYFDLATKHDPRKSNSVLALADLYYQENNIKAASLYLKQYKTMAIHTPKSLLLGIKIAKAQGKTDEEASMSLMLKSMFESSDEYAEYVRGLNER